jgi:hypothetical protein
LGGWCCGPPAVVAARVVHQQLFPGEGGLFLLAPLLLCVSEPEPVAGPKRRGELVGGDGVQHGDHAIPVALQQELPGHLPLQVPAGGILGPALQHGQGRPPAAVAEGEPRLDGGAVLPARRELLQVGRGGVALLLTEQAHSLIRCGGVRPLLHHLDQQGGRQALGVRRAFQKSAGQRQPPRIAEGPNSGRFWTLLAQAAKGPSPIPRLRQTLGQLGVLGSTQGSVGAQGGDGLPGPWPAGSPLGQMEGALLLLRFPWPRLQGGRKGGWVRREAAEQLLAKVGLLASQGIEGIGAGRFLREAPQQLAPEGHGLLLPDELLPLQGRLLDHHGSQRIRAPTLASQPLALAFSAVAGLAGKEQGGLPSPLGIRRPTPLPLQLADGRFRCQGGAPLQQGAAPQESGARAQARDQQQEGEAGQDQGSAGGILTRHHACSGHASVAPSPPPRSSPVAPFAGIPGPPSCSGRGGDCRVGVAAEALASLPVAAWSRGGALAALGRARAPALALVAPPLELNLSTSLVSRRNPA